MAKYRKKPVVIEAIQFNGRNSADIHEFCGDKVREPVGKDYLEIETLEGVHIASPGDYIIKGIKGEFYPCKPDIFEMTYEKVESNSMKLTIDAVPVVRCKDCKHYNTIGCSKGFGWCENIDRGTSDNFYCANGKQLNKESEDD